MKAIEHYRKGKRWTQVRMGEELGVTDSLICYYESGARIPPAAKQKFIERITRGAVPVWCWPYEVFVFDDPKTWPATGAHVEASMDGKSCGESIFISPETGTEWANTGITHYRFGRHTLQGQGE